MIERIKYIVRDIDDEIMGAQHYANFSKSFARKIPKPPGCMLRWQSRN